MENNNPTPNTTPTNTESTPTNIQPSSGNKKTTAIVIIAIVIILAAVSIGVILNIGKPNNTNTNATEKPSNSDAYLNEVSNLSSTDSLNDIEQDIQKTDVSNVDSAANKIDINN